MLDIYKRRLISVFLCVSILSCSYFSFYTSTKTYADALALPMITSGIMATGTGGALTATITAAAPYALVLLAAGIAAGCVYKNRAQINNFVCGAVDYLGTVGQGIGVGLRSAKDGAGYITGQAKTELLDYMKKLQKLNYQLKSFVRDVALPAGATVWTNFTFKLHEDINLAFKSVWQTLNAVIVFKVGTKEFTYSLRDRIPEVYFYNGAYRIGTYDWSLPSSYGGESVSVGFRNPSAKVNETISVDHVVDYGANSVCPSGTISYGDTPFANSVDSTKVVANSGVTSWDSIKDKTASDVIGTDITVGNVTEQEMEKEIGEPEVPEPGDIGLDEGSWNKGSYESAEASLTNCYDKYGQEVGATDVQEYLNKARSFKQNLSGSTKQRIDGPVEGAMRYSKNSKYIDLAPDGTIISFQSDDDTVEEDDTSKWFDEDGNPIWPPNRGFDGAPTTEELKPGTLVDRYGYDGGTFVSPKGTPYTERALPPGTDSKPYTVFEVVESVEVKAGKIAPWFGEKGGGIQYEFSSSIAELLKKEVIRKVGN